MRSTIKIIPEQISKNRLIILLILIWMSCTCNYVFAQLHIGTAQGKTSKKARQVPPGHLITGTVADETGFPAIGAKVGICGTDVYVFTNIDGNFSIMAATGSILVFEYHGYQDAEQAVTDQGTYSIGLEPDPEETVSIISYASQPRIIPQTCAIPNITSQPIRRRSLFGRVFCAIGNILNSKGKS